MLSVFFQSFTGSPGSSSMAWALVPSGVGRNGLFWLWVTFWKKISLLFLGVHFLLPCLIVNKDFSSTGCSFDSNLNKEGGSTEGISPYLVTPSSFQDIDLLLPLPVILGKFFVSFFFVCLFLCFVFVFCRISYLLMDYGRLGQPWLPLYPRGHRRGDMGGKTSYL